MTLVAERVLVLVTALDHVMFLDTGQSDWFCSAVPDTLHIAAPHLSSHTNVLLQWADDHCDPQSIFLVCSLGTSW